YDHHSLDRITAADWTLLHAARPQRAAIPAVGARFAERVVDGKGHYSPFPKRVECRLFAPGGKVWSKIDHFLDRCDFFAGFDRALRRFSRSDDSRGLRVDLDREFAANTLVDVLGQVMHHGFAQF